MKIAIDLLSLPSTGGTLTYANEVLPRLCSRLRDCVVIIRPDFEEHFKRLLGSNAQLYVAPAATRNIYLRHLYQRVRLPRLLSAWNAQVLWIPGGVSGTRRKAHSDLRLVSMVRNMLPFEPRERKRFSFFAEPGLRLKLWLLRFGMEGTISSADRMIFISRHSAETVGKNFPNIDRRIIPHGIGKAFVASKQEGDEQVLKKYGIRMPYFLYVSTLDPYKHQDVVVRGFEEFRKSNNSDAQLVLAGAIGGNGSKGSYGRSVGKMIAPLGQSVVCTDLVAREDLPSLCRHAEILIFASTCETCPNILLEYLGSGRPIICSNTAPMPEFAGDAALYVNAEDPGEWCRDLTELTKDPMKATQLCTLAKERSKQFSWEETLSKTIAALTEW